MELLAYILLSVSEETTKYPVSSVMMTLDNRIVNVGWMFLCCFASDVGMQLLIKRGFVFEV